MRATLLLCLTAAFFTPLSAQTVNVILRGKVTMEDGSPPPKSVGLEKFCSTSQGDAPGPVTNKQGEYTWRMDVNPMSVRRCYIRASLKDYRSTQIEISDLSGYIDVNINLPTIILSPFVPDPTSLDVSNSGVPGSARDAWNKSVDALQEGDIPATEAQLRIVTEKAPKFSRGWLNLGIVQENLGKLEEARASFQQAVAADPKAVTPYVTLARSQIKVRDWAAAAKTSADGIAADKKRTYAELFLHRAVALFEQGDLAGAEEAALAAFDPKEKLKAVRGEIVLARILEKKGDLAGAKEHAAHYLQAAPSAKDKDTIQAYIDKMGQPDAPQPELEVF